MVKPRIPEGEAIVDSEEVTMEQYSENARKRERMYRGVVKHLIGKVGIPPNAQVLQIGPGPDWIGIWLIQERSDISLTGLEPSPDMIRVAKGNAIAEGLDESRIRYTVGVVENLSMFEDDSFDFIFSNESLHHWVNPIAAFSEIRRVLKPSGNLCLLDDHRDLSIAEKFVVEIFGRIVAGKWHRWWKSSIQASYTVKEIEEYLQELGIDEWNVDSEFLSLRIQKISTNP
ncbi:MAG: class I SAM-dependent methyltransferase [Candidatus Thorarchaeota archaeon]|nr:class I SAM-dependent methyltransferase [Candidatus Thorarchaeota archaeon]